MTSSTEATSKSSPVSKLTAVSGVGPPDGLAHDEASCSDTGQTLVDLPGLITARLITSAYFRIT